MSTTNSFVISFITRSSKVRTSQSTVYCRISVEGRRTEFALVKSIPTNSWNAAKEKINSSYPDFRKSNTYLEHVRARLTEINRERILNRELITPHIIKNIFFGKSDDNKTLSYLVEYHWNTQQNVLTDRTFAQYKTLNNYLKLFLTNIKKVDDIYLNRIDYAFVTEFEAFLRAHEPTDHQRKMANNTVMKHLTKFKKLINLAFKLEWIKKNPFNQYTISYTKVDRGFLTKQELQTIQEKSFKLERLNLVKDLFIFACYSGLSYIDLQQLTLDSIIIGIDGELWIKDRRQKTDSSISIPILPQASAILDKYKNHPRSLHNNSIFPPISNQKINSYLKEIADFCGIKKNVTFHLARHTFATTVTLANGVPIETVSKLLGHLKLSTTQIYARVLQNKISDDMNMLRSKLEGVSNALDSKRKIN
ncbi:site-specific integrase [Labilibacter marinus]|uniref:site-specific integrase n=1 Tax=Labilibacter marinus TaxID=1477105 RepID=UPI00094F92BB|nr:site-specific integrase [Labilibacter marinus]